MTDDELKKYRAKTPVPEGWRIEEAERSTCQYILLRNSDDSFVTGYGKTKKEAMKAALRKIAKKAKKVKKTNAV